MNYHPVALFSNGKNRQKVEPAEASPRTVYKEPSSALLLLKYTLTMSWSVS